MEVLPVFRDSTLRAARTREGIAVFLSNEESLAFAPVTEERQERGG